VRFSRRMKACVFVFALVACFVAVLAFVSNQNTARADRKIDPGEMSAPVLLQLISAQTGQETYIKAEVARTAEEFERGLMYRTSLAENAGMLFLFDQSRDVSFWMKNTLISLDVLFIRDDGIITKIAARTKTNDLTPIPSEGPVASVLEIKGGEAERLGIKVGDSVK